MKFKIVVFIFFSIIIFQCKKDPIDGTKNNSNNLNTTELNDTLDIIDTIKNRIDSILFYSDFILAGDSITYKYYKINSVLENISIGDSVPALDENTYSNMDDKPLNIDYDEIFDIRYGSFNFYRNEYSISKGFFIANNYGNQKEIEFAIEVNEVLSLNNNEKIIKLFDNNDTIDSTNNWISNTSPELYFLSLLNKHEPYFKDYLGTNLSINGNITQKYIGVRRKIENKYIYGWIRISIINHEYLKIIGSTFSYWYEIKN